MENSHLGSIMATYCKHLDIDISIGCPGYEFLVAFKLSPAESVHVALSNCSGGGPIRKHINNTLLADYTFHCAFVGLQKIIRGKLGAGPEQMN